MCVIQLTVFFIFHRYFVLVLSQFSSPYRVEAVSCVLTEEEAAEEKKRFNERRQTHGRPTRASARGDGRSSEEKKTKKRRNIIVSCMSCAMMRDDALLHSLTDRVSSHIAAASSFLAFIIFISHFFFCFDDVACAPKSIYRQTWSCRAAKCYFFSLHDELTRERENPRHFVRSSSSFDFLMFGSHFFSPPMTAMKISREFLPFPPSHSPIHTFDESSSEVLSAARESMMSWERFFFLDEFADMSESLTAHHVWLWAHREFIEKVLSDPQKVERAASSFLAVSSKNSRRPRKPNELSDGHAECGWGSLATFFSTLFFIALFCKFRIIFFWAQFESLLCNLNKVFNLTVEVDEMKWEEKVFSRRPTIVIFSSTSHEPTAIAQYLQFTTADLLATAVQWIRHMSPENTWRCASAIITTEFA